MVAMLRFCYALELAICLTVTAIMPLNGDRRLEGVLRGSRAMDAIWYGCALLGCIDG